MGYNTEKALLRKMKRKNKSKKGLEEVKKRGKQVSRKTPYLT